MSREQTRKQHAAQRDMVVRSLLVAPNRTDRGEERPRKHVKRVAPPVFVDLAGHTYVIPVVHERRPL